MRSKKGVLVPVMLMVLAFSFKTAYSDQEQPKPIEDNPIILFMLFDQLEYRINRGPNTFHWDVQGWLGGDYNRLWIKTEGNQQVSKKKEGEIEMQLLYSRLISPYFDLQAGVRHDQLYQDQRRSRTFGVLGLQGLALYWFEAELSLYFSEKGDVSARFTGEYDIPVTQRLVLQPRVETEVAAQEVESFGVGQGFNEVEVGVRLRYEIRREFAPYIGVSWTHLFGETRDIARNNKEETDNLALLFGVRLWF